MSDAKHEPKVIVSGIQPSGSLHVGNYVGAIRNWLRLQRESKAKLFFFIADYHSISGEYSPEEKRQQVLELATDLLALGIDPKRATLFVQSHVPEHTELCWILNTVTPVSFMERMTQFKDKSEDQSKNVNMGLFDYPVLQAADILMYHGDGVPVGTDQVQHVELTRNVARFFNNKFGAYFPDVRPVLTDIPKVRSLADPLKKMSKSHIERSYIALNDAPDVILDKLKRAVTETTGRLSITKDDLESQLAALEGTEDDALRGQAGVWNLLELLRVFGNEEKMHTALNAQPMKYGDLKTEVATVISDHFADYREKRAKLAKRPNKVNAILRAGAKKAQKTAQRTMKDVRERIGVR